MVVYIYTFIYIFPPFLFLGQHHWQFAHLIYHSQKLAVGSVRLTYIFFPMFLLFILYKNFIYFFLFIFLLLEWLVAHYFSLICLFIIVSTLHIPLYVPFSMSHKFQFLMFSLTLALNIFNFLDNSFQKELVRVFYSVCKSFILLPYFKNY